MTGNPYVDGYVLVCGWLLGAALAVASSLALVAFVIGLTARAREARRPGRFHGARCRELIRTSYGVDDSGTRSAVLGECAAPLRAVGGDDYTVDYLCEAGHAYRAEHYPVREGYLARLAASDRPGAPRPAPYDPVSPEEPAGDPVPGRVAPTLEGATHASRPLREDAQELAS